MDIWVAFYVLTIVNNVATKHYKCLFELVFSFSLDEYPKVELLDHMLVLFLIFRGTSILFSVVAAPFTFPPTVHKGSFFSISSPTFVIPSLFDNRYSNRCEVISHCVFYLYFPDYQ